MARCLSLFGVFFASVALLFLGVGAGLNEWFIQEEQGPLTKTTEKYGLFRVCITIESNLGGGESTDCVEFDLDYYENCLDNGTSEQKEYCNKQRTSAAFSVIAGLVALSAWVFHVVSGFTERSCRGVAAGLSIFAGIAAAICWGVYFSIFEDSDPFPEADDFGVAFYLEIAGAMLLFMSGCMVGCEKDY